MPSELKICDVQEIFTRFKKVPAEKIIARLLGEVYSVHAPKVFRQAPTALREEQGEDKHQVSRGLVCKKVQWRWKGQCYVQRFHARELHRLQLFLASWQNQHTKETSENERRKEIHPGAAPPGAPTRQ
jgi:hypothetical protein